MTFNQFVDSMFTSIIGAIRSLSEGLILSMMMNFLMFGWLFGVHVIYSHGKSITEENR